MTVPDGRPLSVLEMGTGWFGEQAGGLERYFAGLMDHGADAGLRCRGLVVGSAEVARLSGGRVTAYASSTAPLPRRWVAARRAVAEAIDAEPVDLWASHFALYALPVLRQLRRLPTVVHFHGPVGRRRDSVRGNGRWPCTLKRLIERRVYLRADRLIVLSEAFRAVLCESFAVDPGRVRVIPGGVDVDRFQTPLTRAQAREQLGWPADRPVLLCVRRLVHRMGLHLLVDAVAQLRERHPDLLCVIGGRGPLAEHLAADVAARGLSDHIRLVGFVPDDVLPVAYRAADLSVVPSEAWEGFGLITVESLAAGTPVVVTPVGGLPEVVRPLSPDLVTTAATAAAVAERLDDCVAGRVVLPTADDCRQYAREHFGWPAVARRVAEVYREACG